MVYSGCWAETWRWQLVVALSLLRLSQVVKRGHVFGQVGGNGGQSGEETILVDLRGHTPTTCGQKGESFCPLQRRGPVRPRNVFE